MGPLKFLSRRRFLQTAAAASAGWCASGAGWLRAWGDGERTLVFKVAGIPAHDGLARHLGVERLLRLMAGRGLPFYQSAQAGPLSGPDGLIAADDVVLIKINCQWYARGMTNTDVIAGVISRVLEHPDGFSGEVVIVENGQGRGHFDGVVRPDSAYVNDTDILGTVCVNAEQPGVTTVNHLVDVVFAGSPVSAFRLDGIRGVFIGDGEHVTDGYRTLDALHLSYPCFTTAGGNRVELAQGVWTGAGHGANLKLINLPVLKHHDTGGTGVTGALKHCYGLVSMSDGFSSQRHYSEAGAQPGRFYTQVRPPDLNILDCIWVSHGHLRGYPPENTARVNMLLAGLDPVALDYHAAKHVLLPLGGPFASSHDPDNTVFVHAHLEGACQAINDAGGIWGRPAVMSDDQIEVVAAGGGAAPWLGPLLKP